MTESSYCKSLPCICSGDQQAIFATTLVEQKIRSTVKTRFNGHLLVMFWMKPSGLLSRFRKAAHTDSFLFLL